MDETEVFATVKTKKQHMSFVLCFNKFLLIL